MVVVGKRRLAIARAIVEKGSGKVFVNSKSLEEYFRNKYLVLFVKEPLILANGKSNKVDIFVNVGGGGIIGQAEAVRQAIAKSLLEFYKDEELKKVYLDYDRNLIVYDPRRNEPHHSSGKGASKRGSRKHRQRSKR